MTVRASAFLVPMAASFGAALLTQRWFDRTFPSAPWVAGAAFSLIAAMLTLLVGERIGRRFLPLAMLLKLALLFPDQVPSRLAIALRAASPRRLAKKLESADADEATAAGRVLALVSALSAHDRLTRGHSERVRAVTMLIADEMGITGVERDKLEWAALLHDVGKMTVSPAILNKRGAPDDAEWAELRTHPGNGAPLAGELAEWLGDTIHAIDQHHERFDGTGYPLGLSGNQISQSARIVAAADAFEVMTAVRSYKNAMPVSEARAELAACQGTHFDPLVVRSVASVSLARLHRALGPASWAMSLPFRGVIAQAFRGAGALVGGSAPSALAGLTAAFALSVASASMADAVDGRFDAHQQASVETAAVVLDATAAPEAAPLSLPDPTTPTLTPAETEDRTENSAGPATTADPDDASSADHTETDETDEPDDEAPSNAATPTPSLRVPGIDLSTLTETELEAVGTVIGIDLTGLTDDQLDAAQDVLQATLDSTAGLIDTALDSTTDLVDTTVDSTTDLVDTTVDSTTDLVDTTVDSTTDLVDTTVDSATDLVGTAVNNLTTASTAGEVVENTLDTVGAATEVAGQSVTGAIETVTETVQQTAATAAEVVEQATETVTESVQEVAETVTEIEVDPVVVPVPSSETVVETVVEPVEPVVEPVAEPLVETVVEPVIEPAVDPVVEPVIEPAVDPVVETVVEPVETVVEPIEETIGGPTSGGLLGS